MPPQLVFVIVEFMGILDIDPWFSRTPGLTGFKIQILPVTYLQYGRQGLQACIAV